MVATKARSAACIELLAAAGAKLQPCTADDNPLMVAVCNEDVDCISALIGACACSWLAMTASDGNTALEAALSRRNASLTKLLAAAMPKLTVRAGVFAPNANVGRPRGTRGHGGIIGVEEILRAASDPAWREAGRLACIAALQDESRWRRRRPLALVCEQRQAARDAALARRVLQQDDDSGVGGVDSDGVATSGDYTATTLSGGGIKQCQGAGVKERPAVDNLLAAVSTGDAERLWRLINAGADVNAVVRTKTGDAALHVAVEGGHRECAAALVEAGANTGVANTLGITPLLAACANGHVGCAQVMVDHCTMQGVAGDALVIAAWRGQKACVALLAKAGHMGLVHSVFGRHALLAAVATGHIGCVSTLARHGANLEVNLTVGRTALQVAVESGNAECVGALIAAGADVDPAKTRRESRSHGGLWDDEEPVFRAMKLGSPAIVALLLRAGAAQDLLAALDENSYRRWDETMREVLQCEARWRRRRGLLLLREQRIAARDAVEARKRSKGKRRKGQ